MNNEIEYIETEINKKRYNIDKIKSIEIITIENKNLKLKINDEIFECVKDVAKGSTAIIKEYKNERDESLIIKMELTKDSLSEEIEIQNYLHRNKLNNEILIKNKHYVIPYYKFKWNIMVMEYMDGTLMDIINNIVYNKLEFDIKIKIIHIIIKSIWELSQCGLYYTDIKPENILYKYITNKKIKIIFGDIGGIYINKNNFYGNKNKNNMNYGIATYPTLDASINGDIKNVGFLYNIDKKDLVWIIGINMLFILHLPLISYIAYRYNKLKYKLDGEVFYEKIIKKDIELIRAILLNNYDKESDQIKIIKVINILKGALTIDKNERIELYEILKKISDIIYDI